MKTSKELKNSPQELKNSLGFITGHDPSLSKMFNDWGFDTTNNIKFLDDADFILFSDDKASVTPFLYGHKRSSKCGPCNFRLDMRENKIFRSCVDDLPKFGIGRGALFLNVMNGGTLYQSINNHDSKPHIVRLFYDEKLEQVKGYKNIFGPSNHTQGMIPSKVTQALILGKASVSSERWVENNKIEGGNHAGSYLDNEIIYYYDTNSLCFQPQVNTLTSESHPCRLYFKGLFKNIMQATYKTNLTVN